MMRGGPWPFWPQHFGRWVHSSIQSSPAAAAVLKITGVTVDPPTVRGAVLAVGCWSILAAHCGTVKNLDREITAMMTANANH